MTEHAPPLWTRRDFTLRAAGASAALWAWSRSSALPKPDAPTGAPVLPLTAPAGDRVAAFVAYRPQHDPDAPFFRSFVRRATQIAPLAATQAHPKLDPRPHLGSLTGCYRTLGPTPSDVYKKQRYGTPPPGGVYVSRMIGSHDMLVSWSGPGLIPNPALTDAAHRNGALCLGCVFQPDHRMYDGSTIPARVTAARLVELAGYFGFDGYFVNFENGTKAQHAQVLAWIGTMRAEAHRRRLTDFTVQFYDGSADIARLLPILAGAAAGRSDAASAMLDQGWSGYSMTHGCCSGLPTQPSTVAAYCAAHGFDRFRSAYFGFQLYPGPGYFGMAAPAVITPNTAAETYGSLQIYSWDDGLYNLEAFAAPEAPPAEREHAFYRLERLFFMGQSGDPAAENTPTAAQAALYAGVAGGTRRYTDVSGEPRTADHIDDQARLPITYGVRNFITERSVVGSLPFVTHFNVGAGEAFFLSGAQVSDRAWFSLGAQDILPTWQWWQTPMEAQPDGQEAAFAPLSIGYDTAVAWNGGASLRLTGSVSGAGVAVRLYKTDLLLQGDLCAQMVWRGDGAGPESVRCGLIFADALEAVIWVPAGRLEQAGSGWTRGTFSLAPFAGRRVAALALGFAQSGRLDLHLGELFLGSSRNAAAAARPRGFRVESLERDANGVHARLRWEFDESIAYYDIFAMGLGQQNRQWLGRITADCFYAENVACNLDGTVAFGLVAVSRNAPLLESAPASTAPRAPSGA